MIEADAAKCAELLKGVDTIILDCDGVLWRGAKAIPGASTAVSHLRALGKRLFFLTNNSTKDRQSLVEKFRALGFTAHLGELIGSSYLLAVFLDGHPALSNPSTAVYVIGREGIIKELGHVGISTLGGPVSIRYPCDDAPSPIMPRRTMVSSIILAIPSQQLGTVRE